ncbi:MAG: sulfite exporter TauE/SafE family protein [Bacteroidia bacterium]|nr:sulfite exporter TauE/SafE family protein [Bacteroidia bacterium]NNF30825.1 sulfite exporter TauE/SafE family protein [Flavobacteriaceae bacterium]MBT8275468.1 sulfite exporter TauE/SafE family protein [Bacteroidia bacterium]NNJ81998.1 sulfite exporter TauE/SafE family protein [Flavobacteriaceae bacterium]NNK54438.1 sulfite exporter TauE/SafE family protein [Flavobacteriaceae bacterium]
MLTKYLPAFIILSLLAEIFGTVGGFGSSVFFVPVANYFLDFQAVLGITALFHVSSNITKIAFFKKGIDKKIILTLGVPAVLFVILGAYVSKFFDPVILTYILGGFLVTFSLLFLIFNQLEVKPKTPNAIIGGVLSGFSAGILGTGGAIRGMTLAAFKMSKDKFIATSAVIDLGVDSSRTVVYYFNGYMKMELLYLIPILIVIGILGTWIGKRILKYISHEQFRYIVLFLILGIGIASIVTNPG